MKTYETWLLKFTPYLLLVGCSAPFEAETNPGNPATGGSAPSLSTLPLDASTGGQTSVAEATGGDAPQAETGGASQVLAGTGGTGGTGGRAPMATGGQSAAPDPCAAWKAASFCCGGKLGCVTGQDCVTYIGSDSVRYYGCYSPSVAASITGGTILGQGTG